MPEPGEYVALGAARQAAWALAGHDRSRRTGRRPDTEVFSADPTPAVRQQYAMLRDATAGW